MSAAIPELIESLFTEAQRYLAGMDEPSIQRARQSLAQREIPAVVPQRLPVLDWLGSAMDSRHVHNVSNGGLLAALVGAADYLVWHRSYTASEVGDRFLQRYGWSELVGRRGLVVSRYVRCGFLLLGPHIEYPAHAHSPQEIYWPLTDASYWQKDSPNWSRGIPHRPIYHAAWMSHAMRTGDTPLVALYVWHSGELGQKPSFGPCQRVP